MKRRALHIIVLLLLGAIVNVPVAWGCRFLGVRGATSYQSHSEQYIAKWYKNRVGDDVLPDFHWEHVKGLGYEGFELSGYRANREWIAAVCVRRGIPVPSLECAWWQCGTRLNAKHSSDGIRVGGNSDRLLPIRPIWPGFAINTIFYAAILWVVWFVPSKFRRTLRRGRGLCPACAYPVGTSNVCTECGNLVRGSAKSG